MAQNWGRYRKEKNCGRDNHKFVVPRTKKRTYMICKICQSHKTIKPHRRK